MLCLTCSFSNTHTLSIFLSFSLSRFLSLSLSHRSCTYSDHGKASSSELQFLADGDGGFSQLTSHLRDNDVTYGALLCRVGPVVKPIFLTWVGPHVSPTYRGRVSMHKQGVRNFYVGCCCELFCTDMEDITVQAATVALCKATTEADCSVETLGSGSSASGRHAVARAAQRERERKESLESISTDLPLEKILNQTRSMFVMMG